MKLAHFRNLISWILRLWLFLNFIKDYIYFVVYRFVKFWTVSFGILIKQIQLKFLINAIKWMYQISNSRCLINWIMGKRLMSLNIILRRFYLSIIWRFYWNAHWYSSSIFEITASSLIWVFCMIIHFIFRLIFFTISEEISVILSAW